MGIFGSDDILAIDQAVLDVTARTPLIKENVPTSMEVHTREGHPLRWLHGPLKDPYVVTQYGERLGLGTRNYELIDVLPVEQITRAPIGYIAAKQWRPFTSLSSTVNSQRLTAVFLQFGGHIPRGDTANVSATTESGGNSKAAWLF